MKQVSLTLEVTPEPGLQWLGVRTLRLDRAVDDQGQVLKGSPVSSVSSRWERNCPGRMFPASKRLVKLSYAFSRNFWAPRLWLTDFKVSMAGNTGDRILTCQPAQCYIAGGQNLTRK